MINKLITDQIIKENMLDYEFIRESSLCNMFDYYSVMRIAKKAKMNLGNFTLDQYKLLLMNFNSLMKHYNIIQY
jgi:hypothetical protein